MGGTNVLVQTDVVHLTVDMTATVLTRVGAKNVVFVLVTWQFARDEFYGLGHRL